MRTRAFHDALEVHHDVLRRDVAVDYVQRLAVAAELVVRVLEPPTDAADDERAELDRELLRRVEVPVEVVLERDTVDVFHRGVVAAARAAELVDLDDVLMDEIGHELRFADEHLDELEVRGEVLADGLDGDALVEALDAVLDRLEDRAHPALGDLAGEPVAPRLLDGVALDAGLALGLGCQVVPPCRAPMLRPAESTSRRVGASCGCEGGV
jgi:hypothetical protein